MFKYFLNIILCFLALSDLSNSQKAIQNYFPKYEVRAAWLTTVGGLDWPKTTNIEEQKRTLLEILNDLKDKNFNTIFFQVRSRGDAMYNSSYEPWSETLTGILGKDPGWDPLQFVLNYAHSYGLEVHAWFNTFRIRKNQYLSVGERKHISEIYPEWVKYYENEAWLDPGIPEVRNYTLKVALDLVRNYDIDGIHFDFIRYPGSNFPDELTYSRYGKGESKDDWRRENINKFVRAFYDSAMAIKPMLKVGSAPIGVYKNLPNAIGWQSYSAIYQDSRRWLKEEKHDYLAPQLYWSLGTEPGDPDFATLAKDWCENKSGRHIYLGIGAYKKKVSEQLPLLIDVTRLYGAEGNSIFRYEFLNGQNSLANRYAFPAFIPPMPWKDSIPPNPPTDLTVQEIDQRSFKILWQKPNIAKDGDNAKFYCIYRSNRHPVDINNPANIIALVPGSENEYIDKISRPRSSNYYYVVTAFDKGNNESYPAFELKVEMPLISNIAKRVAPEINISHYKNPLSDDIYLIYELNKPGNLKLKLFGADKNEIVLINERYYKPGKYVLNLSSNELKSGYYTIELSIDEQTFSKNIYLKN